MIITNKYILYLRFSILFDLPQNLYLQSHEHLPQLIYYNCFSLSRNFLFHNNIITNNQIAIVCVFEMNVASRIKLTKNFKKKYSQRKHTRKCKYYYSPDCLFFKIRGSECVRKREMKNSDQNVKFEDLFIVKIIIFVKRGNVM